MQVPMTKIRSEIIRRQMRQEGLKQYWVAESAGIAPSTLRRWLNGSITHVRWDHVQKLADVLTIPTEQICLTEA